MSPDDPDLDALSDSVAHGEPVDWDAVQSGASDPAQRAQLDALRGIARIVEYHQDLQRTATATASAGSSHPGSVRPEPWGDLTILELASAGANGEVWRAWDAWLQRDVALKFLQTVSGPAPETAESPLLEEARALARVRHPGVVAVHGIAEHN